MSTKKFLQDAKALLEQGWTQKTYARDADGISCDLEAPYAACWCILGAMRKLQYSGAYTTDTIYHARQLVANAVPALPTHPTRCAIAEFNDTPGRTKEEILAIFNQAIKEAQ